MKEFDRRTFLKIATTIAVGTVVSETLLPLEDTVNGAVMELTGHPVGNVQIREKVEQTCEYVPDPKDCLDHYQFSSQEKFFGIFVNPPAEEVLFRAVPVRIMGIIDNKKDLTTPILQGSGEKLFTRREVFVGVLSAVLYGFAHNNTPKGFDTTTIPASQMLVGSAYWFLQRKFGLAANIIAHSWHNFRLLS